MFMSKKGNIFFVNKWKHVFSAEKFSHKDIIGNVVYFADILGFPNCMNQSM